MHMTISLTVSESKRLIAKGVAQTGIVKNAMQQGILAIGPGSTNGYIVEEITGEKIDKRSFITGRTLPSGHKGPKMSYTRPDLVIRKGERLNVQGRDVLPEMRPGDVYIKGANALNYRKKQVGVLIGDPTGGGVGTALGTIVARRIRYLHPVGLEKDMSADLDKVALFLNRDKEGKGPTLWVVPGDIYTEIEALRTLTDVEAQHISSGGVAGAEGAVWLAIYGTKPQIDKARDVISSVRGEEPFA